MKKMNDQVKYQLERAEDALRTALKFADKESVYVISSISKALIELDNTMFAERIEAAAKEGNTAAQGLISITKEEQTNGQVKYEMTSEPLGVEITGKSSKSIKWNNKAEFVPAKPQDTDGL